VIQKRIVFVLLLCMLLSVALVSAVSIRAANRILREDSVQQLRQQCEANQLRLNSLLDGISQSVNVLAEYAQSSLGDYAAFQTDSGYVDRYAESMRGMAKTAAANTAGCISVYLRFNPAFTPPTSGLFLLRGNSRREFTDQTPTDLSAYAPGDTGHVGWYYIPVSNGRATWLAPYENENVNVSMLSYVVPLYRNGACFGVAGMDIDYDLVCTLVNGIQLSGHGYAFLMDDAQHVVVHPTLRMFTSLQDVDGGALTRLFEDGRENEIVSGEYRFHGVRKSMAAARLKNGMTLVLAVPTKEIFQTSADLTARILLLTAAALGLMLLGAALVIARMLRPASADPLTGISNRGAFFSQLQSRLSGRRGGPFAFILLDIDFFKRINDTQGHAAGDCALRQTAAFLGRVLGPEDLIGRFGGDEFMVFMQCGARSIAERRLRQFQDLMRQGGEVFPQGLTCSIGVVYSGDYSLTADQLVQLSDRALYAAKNQGRDRIVFQDGSRAPAP
jgi:diguanylate cyclase (GGDEF)-like protein